MRVRLVALGCPNRDDSETGGRAEVDEGAALQIVSEGLSNILRHSQAKQAYVALRNEGHRLLIEIGNEAAAGAPNPEFTPRSIAARTRSLGGTCVVERDALGYTIVRVIIPL